jgi:predicted O-methyltransferase YrrM
MVRQWIRDLIGKNNIATFDFFIKPKIIWWGRRGPFNGQRFRQSIYAELLKEAGFDAIVETGTYHGITTELFAASGLPVYSVEINPQFYRHTAARLADKGGQIHLGQGDSRRYLRDLAHDGSLAKAKLFFYLDAHWYENLPLAEELEIIFGTWHQAVVMVDDFAVPGTEYSYDNFGPGNVLDASYLETVSHLRLFRFYPSAPPFAETGGKRGCIVLCQDANVAGLLKRIKTLAPGDQEP